MIIFFVIKMKKTNIHFKIHYKTQFGDNLYVIGNNIELGNWIPHNALKL